MADSASEEDSAQGEDTFLYFAYGSNLLTERIHLRNPSAKFCCVARLQVRSPSPLPPTLSSTVRRRKPLPGGRHAWAGRAEA